MFSRTFLILSNHSHFSDKNCLIFLLLQRDLFEVRKLKDVGLNHMFVPGKYSAHSVAAYTERVCVRWSGMWAWEADRKTWVQIPAPTAPGTAKTMRMFTSS